MRLPIPTPVKKYLKPTPMNLMIGAGLAFSGYVLYQYFTNGSTLKLLPDKETVGEPPAGAATRVYFQTYPAVARPGGMLTISGYFANSDGDRITVPKSFFYVLDDQGYMGRELVFQGSLGTNLSEFNKVISLPRLKNGTFTVLVSDYPLGDMELGTQNPGLGPGGSGSRPRGRYDPPSLTNKPDLNPV